MWFLECVCAYVCLNLIKKTQFASDKFHLNQIIQHHDTGGVLQRCTVLGLTLNELGTGLALLDPANPTKSLGSFFIIVSPFAAIAPAIALCNVA